MLDLGQYDDIQLDLPNIMVKWKAGADRTGYTFNLSNNLRDLVIEAATKHPNWLFVCGGERGRGLSYGMTKEQQICNRMFVFEGREEIGWLSWEYRGRHNEPVYLIGNDRISNQRERGTAAKTKDLKKALRLIEKTFSKKTIDEYVLENHKEVASRLYYMQMEKDREFHSSYSEVAGYLRNHVLSNWDTYKEIALAYPRAKADVVDSVLSKYEEQLIAKEIQKCFATGKGAVVTIHGNDYAVSSHSSGNSDAPENVEIYGTDTLPSWIRGRVGMLKLIEKGQMLRDAGYRLTDNVFFVMRGNND